MEAQYALLKDKLLRYASAKQSSWPYRKSLAAAKWIRGICEAVRGLSEGALALAGGAGAWLNLAAAADGEIHELTRLLEVEGMAQNSMDGMEELRLALATLDPKRVAGGKETVADWKRRLSRLEAIIQEAQEESQLQGTLQDLVTQARGHTDPRFRPPQRRRRRLLLGHLARRGVQRRGAASGIRLCAQSPDGRPGRQPHCGHDTFSARQSHRL